MSGDKIAASLPLLKKPKSRYVRFLSKKFLGNQENTMKQIKKVLAEYDPAKGTILYHQMNSFAIPSKEILELSNYFNVRLVSTLVDLQDQVLPQHFSAKEISDRMGAYEINFHHASHIISISEFLVPQISYYLDIEASNVTPAPLGHEHFSTRESEASIRKRIPFGSEYVLFPAKSWKHKGHLGYLNELIRTKPDLRTVFVGDLSTIENQLEDLRKDDYINENCLFLNYVTDGEFKFLLENASAMVLPTEYEGFGLPYLEAAVSRVPVITFETEAALEILGKKGALFAPINDFKKIVINTLSVINGNNEEMLNEAQARAKEFTWNETARLTLEGYKKALLKMNEQLNA
jgi:glycosyltransferase involved in cell wall biosynthesis